MKKILLLFNIIFLGTISIQAQLSFQAIPQKKEFKLNEPVRVQFVLSIKNKEVKEIGNVKLPPFSNIQILGDNIFKNQSVSDEESLIEYVYEIILRPIKAGKLKIGAASINIDGKTYTTKPITISISNEGEEEQDRITSPRLQETFLTFKVSNKSPYVNEGVVAQLKFYTRSFDLLNSISSLSAPSFQGAFIQNINEPRKTYEQELINGEVYLSRVINSYLIFPTQSGTITINPFKLTLTLSDGFFEEKDVFIKSAPVQLQVKNLPANAPKDFHGAVGSFALKVIPNKKELKTEEVLTINVEISGNGNISLVKTPDLLVPEGIEKFLPKNTLESVPSINGLLGRISSSNVLVPHKGGDFSINVEPFSYFDPQENQFKNLTIKPIEIKVIGDSTNKKPYIASTINTIKEGLDSTKTPQINLPSLNTKNIISQVLKGEKDKSNWLIIIITTIVITSTLAIIYFGFLKNRKIDLDTNLKPEKEKKLNPLQILSEKPTKKDLTSELFKLKKIAEKGGKENKIEFYTLLENILNEAVKQNLDVSENQFISISDIEERLVNKFGDEFTEEYKTLLLKSQIERYSTISDSDSLNTIYEKAEKLIEKFIV